MYINEDALIGRLEKMDNNMDDNNAEILKQISHSSSLASALARSNQSSWKTSTNLANKGTKKALKEAFDDVKNYVIMSKLRNSCFCQISFPKLLKMGLTLFKIT